MLVKRKAFNGQIDYQHDLDKEVHFTIPASR